MVCLIFLPPYAPGIRQHYQPRTTTFFRPREHFCSREYAPAFGQWPTGNSLRANSLRARAGLGSKNNNNTSRPLLPRGDGIISKGGSLHPRVTKTGTPNLQGWQPTQPTSKGGGITGGNQTNNEAGFPVDTFSFCFKTLNDKTTTNILELIGTGYCLQGCIDPH